MNEKIWKSRATFIATTVICLVFFGIPLIVVVQMIGRRLGNANVSEYYQGRPLFEKELVLYEVRDKVAPERVTWESQDPKTRGLWPDEGVPVNYITRFKLSLPYNTLGSSLVWDLLCAVVLAVLTFIPPLIAYLHFDKQRLLDEGSS